MKKNLSILKFAAPWLLVALVFAIRFSMLLKSSEPAGLDGYFYALQAKSFALNGRLENPDYKIGYYLCGIFAFLFRNPVLGCKIYASLISSLLVYSIFIALKKLKVNYGFSLMGAALCAASFSVSSMCINFINNLTGITFFIVYVSSVFSFKEKKEKSVCDLLFPAVLFILCFLSHLVSAAFAFVFTVLVVLGKLSLKKQVALVVFALIAGFLLFSRQLPRFKSVFSLGPVLPVFSPFMVKAIGYRICLELSLAVLSGWICFLATAAVFWKKRFFNCLIFMIPVLVFPFWNLNVLDMGYRMLLSAVPCIIVIMIFVLDKMIASPRKTLAGVLLSIVLACVGFTTKSVYDENRDPPYAYYKKIVQNIELPDDSLLIAHLGLNHVYTYEKNLRDALNYVPDFYVPVEKLWRLAYGVNPIAIENQLYDESAESIEECLVKVDSSYVLIREDLWQKFLEREEEIYVNNYLNWYNPHTVRPAFIRKKINGRK